ncbi:MAG: prepilin-type N-terminal cleavage/methylation domain-containing protein [bacterium]
MVFQKFKFHISNFNKGFTLIETIITIFIFTILALGTSTLIKDIFINTNQEQLSLNNIDRARVIAFNFTNELRSASVGVDGSYPITQASTSQIIFNSSYGDSAGIVNRIRYFISGKELKKGVIVPSGNLYNQSSEIIKTIGTGINNENENIPLFYYYDNNYDGNSSPLEQPVNINSIKYVKINMIILKQSSRNSTSTFIINTGSSIRNLKTNLGE